MYENNTWTANVVTLFPEMFPGSIVLFSNW